MSSNFRKIPALAVLFLAFKSLPSCSLAYLTMASIEALADRPFRWLTRVAYYLCGMIVY